MALDPANQPASAPVTPAAVPAPRPPAVIVQQPGRSFSRFAVWLLMLILIASLLANFAMYSEYKSYFSSAEGPSERFHSGDHEATDKVAVIRVSGTIMPPFTDRILKIIKKVEDDDDVKAVLLAVDSPGGTVTDSHKIYHRLQELSAKKKKPIFVSMGSLAASGGYFVAMGAGTQAKIFAEPTTWTGSIGVIIPHYEVTELAEKAGFKALPLKTGEFKDSLSPFRSMTDKDKALWENILNQSFDLFLTVIDENRDTLDKEQVRALATGQIYTAQDAKKNGLVDEIGFEEDALDALKQAAHLSSARVVTYGYPVDILEALLGSAKANDPAAQWRALLEMTVPRAMFYCSWGMPVAERE
jgi:protease-4